MRLRDPRFSIPDRSGHLFRHAGRHPRRRARRLAPVDAGRHTDQLSEATAEGAKRRAADRETDLGDAEVATTQQRHRALDAPRHEVTVRRLAVGEPELAAELRGVRQLLYEVDPYHQFGGRHRVQATSGEYRWVCANHHRPSVAAGQCAARRPSDDPQRALEPSTMWMIRSYTRAASWSSRAVPDGCPTLLFSLIHSPVRPANPGSVAARIAGCAAFSVDRRRCTNRIIGHHSRIIGGIIFGVMAATCSVHVPPELTDSTETPLSASWLPRWRATRSWSSFARACTSKPR